MQLIVQHNNKMISNTIVDQLPKVGDTISVNGVTYYVTVTIADVENNLYSVGVLSANQALDILEQISKSGIIQLIKLGIIG